MVINAKGGTVRVGGEEMEYITFGNGSRYLVMIPGLGDGLQTVKGFAIPFSLLYRQYAKKFQVFVFSRKNRISENYSTRDMAKDLMEAMEQMGIRNADIVGVSQGGMIAQYLAIDYPQVVNKLVLVVTTARPNETIRNVLHHWIEMAKAGDYKGIFIDTAEKSYSEKYLKRNRWIYPLMGRIGKPKNFDRFIIMAKACLSHNDIEELDHIKCPALIIGGEDDKIVTGNASVEISEKISGSTLFMYERLGHGLYEEAKDFNSRVLSFLDQD